MKDGRDLVIGFGDYPSAQSAYYNNISPNLDILNQFAANFPTSTEIASMLAQANSLANEAQNWINQIYFYSAFGYFDG